MGRLDSGAPGIHHLWENLGRLLPDQHLINVFVDSGLRDFPETLENKEEPF